MPSVIEPEETLPPSSPPPKQVNTGSIVVKSEPPSAEIYLDGDNIGVTPAIITQILPGKYKLKIKTDGYYTWNQSVEVMANRESSLTAMLQGRDGSLMITSEPTNAEIFINGKIVGRTPETIQNVKPEKYKIKLKLDKYEIWNKEVKIEAEKKLSLTAKLISKYGSISLGSEPTKARIFLDGIQIGTTPARLQSIPHGTHLVEVKMEGFNIWKKSVNVESGKERLLTAILKRKTGSISINSKPENAGIYLNGKYIGETPHRIQSIIPGTHEIQLKMEDYDVWSETVNIEAGNENTISAMLQRSTGTLMIESDPENAIIFVDGKEIGTTPEIIISSAKGKHIIEVRMDGYDIWKENVHIEPGTEKSLTVTLQPKTGSLNINSKPSSASILLDGKETGTTPEKINGLKPGTYQVEAKINGYEDWCESVKVIADKENHITAVLRKLVSTFNVKSEPSNAMVIIDGTESGNTPAKITDLEPGKHIVEIRMKGYETWTESVEANVDKESSITAVLRKLTGSINIKSEPSNSIILFDGVESGNTPATITDLNPGTYNVELKKDGYEGWKEKVYIVQGKETSLTAALQSIPGSLSIYSEPSDATILIDGRKTGTTPLIITGPDPGNHLVEIRKEGFENWSESIKIVKTNQSSLKAVLQLKAGPVCIKSQPSIAEVLIDGKEVGTTPLIITDPSPGTYNVEIKKDGYENWNEDVMIEPGKETALTAVLQVQDGSIIINSSPTGAMIYINGEKTGKAPETIHNMSPGRHLVEARLAGHENWNESVEVTGGRESRLTATLKELTGTINIMSSPPDAIIILDGKEIGHTPMSLPGVNIGIHEVEIQKDGYLSWNKTIKIKAGEENTFNPKLIEIAATANINSKPSNAVIYIDGKEAGKTPAIITGMTTGDHLIEVKIDRYEVWSERVNINPGKEIDVTVELQIKPGKVSIDSTPSKALIFIDGKEIGTAPKTVEGRGVEQHQVELRIKGYKVWNQSINIEPGIETSVMADLEIKSGSVSITSEPTNAMILLDAKKAGYTPQTLTDIVPGKHIIEVRREGYDIWSKGVEVNSDKEIALSASLSKITGSISINSNQSEAVAYLDGENIGTTPCTMESVVIGTHQVEVRKEGYAEWRKVVYIKKGKEISLKAMLRSITASIDLESEPKGAMILLDGKEVGKTPEILTGIKTGMHNVEIRMDGYVSWMKMIKVKAGREYIFTKTLQVQNGSLNVTSRPSNARIFIFDKKAGKTPKTFNDLKPGNYAIEVKLDQYQTWSKNIEIEPGKETNLKALLQLKPGSIVIISEPSNAKILIDGDDSGTTPATIDDIEDGAHIVELKMEGYKIWSENVVITAGIQSNLTAVLQEMKGSININSEPTNATISVNGNISGSTPEHIRNIKPGTHHVEVIKEGLEVWSDYVEVKAGRKIELSITLQQTSCIVNIESTPSNATIFINNKEFGATPQTIKTLNPGQHKIEIQKAGFENWSEVVIVGSDKENTVTALLRQVTGSINIKSDPPQAEILIDDIESGTTPAIINDLSPETHKIDIKMDGYSVWSENLEVEANKVKQVDATLQQMTGSVNINSEPSGALMLIDGKKRGTTPEIITDIKPGKYLLEASLKGYEKWSEKIEVAADKENTVTALLRQITGSINIKSDPPQSEIFIDGIESGTTPAIINDLSPETHKIDIKMDGYSIWRENVEVVANEVKQVDAALQQITGSVSVNSEPSGASIIIDGKISGITPEIITDIKPGKYLLEASLKGYEKWSEKIEVAADKENTVTALLRQITGSINIKSDPPQSEIFIDGIESGTTPAVINDLSPETHKIDIKMDGYSVWSENVEVVANEVKQVDAALQQITGSVSVNSEPSGASIIIDGKISGTTPEIITDIKPGKYLLEVSLKGYEKWSEKIEVAADKENTVTALLRQITGSINIKSDPPQAEILIDDIESGTTPAVINDLSPETHKIDIKMDGYSVWSENVEVVANKVKQVDATLQQMTGSVNINSEPSGASIIIDGKISGITPEIITDIKPGKYLLEASLKGYEKWSEKIEVAADKENTVTALLRQVTGSINIKSDPPQAEILIDDIESGTTPAVINDLSPETHKIDIKMDGYSVWSENVEVVANKVKQVDATLQQMTGSVNINSVPSGASILIDGKKRGTTPEIITDIKPGKYLLETSLKGYEKWSEKIEVAADKENTVTALLRQVTGSINIKSDPPQAEIFIDGIESGTTPAVINDLSPETHKIDIKMDRYNAWSKNIVVVANKVKQINAVLRQMSGSVNINSEPSGALILINGKKYGTTPEIITDIKPGKYLIEVSMEGHEKWSDSVEVGAAEEIPLRALLQKSTGSISIKSTPAKSIIYIDGEEVGATPVTLSSISVGAHDILIKADGHEEWKKSVIIKKGKELSVNAILQLNVGSISIESYPENAIINLDGKEVGKAPKRLTDVIVGTHSVEVLLDGHISWKKTIKLKAGKEISLSADLKIVNKTEKPEEALAGIATEATLPANIITDIKEPEISTEKKKATVPEVKTEPKSNKKSPPPEKQIKLRSTYGKIDDSLIESLPFLKIREKNSNIFLCHSELKHCYEEKPIGDGDVVIDHTTSLMWCQSGSSEYFNLKKANKWLKKMNKNGYAGFKDWRLPTIEEASSLLEFETKNDSFIAPVFDNKQWGTWTGDKSDRGHAWIVTFVNGTITPGPVGSPATFVKPVRSL
ncbi:hypothetical protein SCALIN_C04_0220 [Candidatus Scalindua japonica]|uniref:PEGA domain-containing protein n=1 Tax=Candidatus Scalindua japonica TaxID=1284222 RepID=A0A286TV10_9BACT|nr:PEGA domain-containing protein [Candidatus Scalindua japonica]GAX59732.1 hypothetical protein SCALIN_C04_0220 [Candidatus Scalindua japonica]